MLNESQIGDIWMLFSPYMDKKHLDIAAERYVEMLVEYGVRDRTLINVADVDYALEHAIRYYLEGDNEEDEDDDYDDVYFE